MNVVFKKRKIEAIVIGASAGGIDALTSLLSDLNRDFRLPIIIVIHQPAYSTNTAVELFGELIRLPVKEAEDKADIENATVYFAPTGYHLLIEKNRTFSLSVESPVNYSRPSIDILFESAADAYEDGLVGILLTGANQDGAMGLKVIQDRGGTTIVQDPQTAKFAQMPQSALNLIKPDYVLPLYKIKDFLGRQKKMEKEV